MRYAIVSFLVVVIGCADTAASRSTIATIDTVNGIERVRNAGMPDKWELREVLSLGAVADVETGGAQEFARISGLIADAQGNIYVADAQSLDIRVFDENGRLLRTIGRKGQGPAEFMDLQSIGWLGDSLAAMDGRNARIGIMTTTGEWQGQRPFGRISGSTIRFTQTGPVELYSLAYVRIGNSGRLAFVRQTSQAEADTLVPPPMDPAQQAKGVQCSYQAGGGDAITFFNPSFAPQAVKLPAPNIQLLAYYSGDYRLHFVKPPNDTVRTVERDLAQLTVSNEEWAAEEDRFRQERDKLPPTRTCNASSLPRPAVKSMIRGAFWDDQGRMWVERRTQTGFALDVFSPAGELLAEMTTPERLGNVPLYVRGDRLYLATADSLAVQYVKAFEIVR